MLPILSGLLVLVAAALGAADEGPIFADLRVQAGIAGSEGRRVAVGLICGDLSEGEHGAYAGMVLGVRLDAASGRDATVDGEHVRLYTAGGQGLAGLGFTLGRQAHFEVLALVGGGICGDHTRSDQAGTVGHYRQVGGEVGWYHTFVGGCQLGALAGWSRFDTHLDNGTITGNASGSGVDAALSLGRRF